MLRSRTLFSTWHSRNFVAGKRKRRCPQRSTLVDDVGKLLGNRSRRCAPHQQLAGVGVQHHDLRMRKAIAHDGVEFAGLKVGQRRIEQ